MTIAEDSFRKLNLTEIEDINSHVTEFDEIQTVTAVNVFLRRLLARLSNPNTLTALRHGIESLISAESSISEEVITPSKVVIVLDKDECDPKAIVAMNTYYQTFDIDNTAAIGYFKELWKYSEGLEFPHYDFFQLALKCLCTVNTRIGLIHSAPALLDDFEYKEQDFLKLIQQITQEMAFTLEIDGCPHDVSCGPNGWLIVDGAKILKISDLREEMYRIMVAMYQRQPKHFH